jgi:hypothetical protein
LTKTDRLNIDLDWPIPDNLNDKFASTGPLSTMEPMRRNEFDMTDFDPKQTWGSKSHLSIGIATGHLGNSCRLPCPHLGTAEKAQHDLELCVIPAGGEMRE